MKVVDAQGDTEVKVRASGPTSEMGELIDWFERVTGLTVDVPNTTWRLNRGGKPTRGQLGLEGFDTAQLSSQDATVEDDGKLS